MNKKQNRKKKNRMIDYFLYGVIIFNVFYIVNSNKLLEVGKREEKIGVQAEETQTNEIVEQNEIENNTNDEEQNTQENTIQIEENKENDTEIPSKMGGYNVLGKLVIEKINVNKNILDVSNNDSLKLSVVKLYGPEINSIGNFCICGHNWKGMLKRASELKVGDTFYIIDKKKQNRVDYKIYNIYSCMPKELECLNQDTNNRKEVTIITCNPGGVTRLIIKAKEV